MGLTISGSDATFDPSLGFVPRAAVHMAHWTFNYNPRLTKGPIQQMFYRFRPELATDLSGHWESYFGFFAPLHWRFRSGERVEVTPTPPANV